MANRTPQPFVIEPIQSLDLTEVNTRLSNVQADFEALFQDGANAQGFLEDDLNDLLETLADGYLTNDSGVLTIQTTPIPAADGGTGLASYAVGDLLYASAATTLAKLADVATGNALISGGVTTAPSWGKIGLTTHVSGTLAVGSGGTGSTSFTSGSIPFSNGTILTQDNANLFWDDTNNRLGIGTASPATELHVSVNAEGTPIIRVRNLSSTGTGNAAIFEAGNDALANAFQAGATATTFAATGIFPQDGAWFTAKRPGGLSIAAQDAAGGMRFYTGGSNERGGFTSAGNFYVDTNTLYVDAVNNRVGVLTSSPGVAFHVAGDAAVNATNKFYLDGGSNTYLVEESSDVFAFVAGGNTGARFNGAGNVAYGAAIDSNVGVRFGASLSGGAPTGMQLFSTMTPNAGANVVGFSFQPTYVEAGSGTHSLFIGMTMDMQITAGAAAVTDIYQLRMNTLTAATGTTRATQIYIISPTGATTNYGIWADDALCRFDGNGTHVFELPADATDPTGGGGAATGRIPVTIGGITRYLAYY